MCNSVPYHITVKTWITGKFSQWFGKSKVELIVNSYLLYQWASLHKKIRYAELETYLFYINILINIFKQCKFHKTV